jgi:RHS repeat-associated protein
VTNLVYPGGRNVYYTFDKGNHLTQVRDWSGRITTLGYDLAGRMTSITRPNSTYRTMGYDAAGQLTNIWEQMGNGLPIAWFRLNWTNSGNMAWEFAAPLPHTNAPPTRTMTYDDDNRLARFQGPSMGSLQSVGVDSNGNLTNGPLANDTFIAYAYDARNRLLNAGGVTNGYDPAGNRVGFTSAINSTELAINPNANLPQVLMRIKNGVTNYYVYGAGLLYQATETATATNTLTYHYDYRGSTIALTADNGLVTDRMEYSLYGSLTYRAGTSDTPFLFNGKYGVQTDPNGLLCMQARYYNPYLCRFISADPSGFAGGLNFYAYANANPVSYLDPFGLGAVESGTGGSWLNQALEGTAMGDWAKGFSSGLGSYVNGEDLSRYTPTGSQAYQSGVTSGYGAVPNAIELANLALTMSAVGAAVGTEAMVAKTAASETGAAAETVAPRINVLPSSGNRFVVSPGGDAIIVPRGASGPVPIINQGGRTTGFGFTGGSGGLGLDSRVSNVRIMDAMLPRGPSPGYPAGYVNYQNIGGQSVNPFTGQTIAPNNPLWHIPLTPP